MDLEQDKITLPFSEMKQNALLGYLLANEQFFRLASPRIEPNWFLSHRSSKAYSLMLKFWDTYHVFPSIPEFKYFKDFTAMEPRDRDSLLAHINRCIMETAQIRLEILRAELTEWLHSVMLLNGMMQAKDAYNDQKIKDCYNILMKSIQDVTSTNFDQGKEITFDNYKEFLSEAKDDRAQALSIGVPILDKVLLADATGGGLLSGASTVAMAPVNVGKTRFMITVACHNIRMGKDVLYMTHEDRPEDIRLQVMSNMMGCTVDELFKAYQTPEGTQRLDLITSVINKHLKYVPYNKAGMCVEDVIPVIRSNQETWAANHEGKGFDLFIDDYPAALSTDRASKGNMQKRQADQYVYEQFFQIAFEYKFHGLYAIQTNREGSKINKGISDHRLLVAEDVQESWGPIVSATNVITLNRSPTCEQDDLIIYNIAKSRGNKKGVAVMAKSNFSYNMTHSATLPAVAYYGTTSAEGLAPRFFSEYNNQFVPDHICKANGL